METNLQPAKITENYLTLLPAYGRDYKSRLAVERDFNMNKDFEMASMVQGGHFRGGRCCSKSDFATGTKVKIRYNRMLSSVVITVLC
jgi:hypothetical protein